MNFLDEDARFAADLDRLPADLMSMLHEPWQRQKLKGKRVAYRTRWDRSNERGGTIGRMNAATIWIGAGCFAHDDIISMREIDNG